jgi:hypothetical protein
LIADFQLDYLLTGAEQVRAVVNHDAARTIRRCIDRNLDFDSAARPDDLNSLERRHARAAGKRRLTGAELQQT